MDGQRFDLLTRAIAASRTRRQALGLLTAAVFVGVRPWRTLAAQGESTCAAGLTYCEEASACVDLGSDMNNCGACGAVCESGLVPVECRGGECVRANCPVGIEYCGAVDGCRDLSSDPAHCGACANACASGVCTGGVCESSGGACPEGEVECDGVCVTTCCNNDHCGACGNACTGGLTCFEGQCDCPSGNCPPVTLPNTGTGSAGADSRGASWPAWAVAGAAALAAIGGNRAASRPDRTSDRSS
jgi:hypothetical protein